MLQLPARLRFEDFQAPGCACQLWPKFCCSHDMCQPFRQLYRFGTAWYLFSLSLCVRRRCREGGAGAGNCQRPPQGVLPPQHPTPLWHPDQSCGTLIRAVERLQFAAFPASWRVTYMYFAGRMHMIEGDLVRTPPPPSPPPRQDLPSSKKANLGEKFEECRTSYCKLA